jgi:acyl carrier protein
MENFKEKFINLIIEKCGVDKEQITPNARFTEDLGTDSLDMVELVMDFEKEFKISIPDEVAEEIKTVAQAEEYISNALQKKDEPH